MKPNTNPHGCCPQVGPPWCEGSSPPSILFGTIIGGCLDCTVQMSYVATPFGPSWEYWGGPCVMSMIVRHFSGVFSIDFDFYPVFLPGHPNACTQTVSRFGECTAEGLLFYEPAVNADCCDQRTLTVVVTE